MNKAVIKIKNVGRRLAALVILLSMVFVTVVSAAGEGSSSDVLPIQGGANQSSDSGFSQGENSFAYRLGLTTCFNEELSYDVSDPEAKSNAVQVYGSKYYMSAQGETVLKIANGCGITDTMQYNGSSCILSSSAASCIQATLDSIASGHPDGHYVVTGSNGALSIPPREDVVTELMTALASLGPKNAALVERWKQEKYSEELAKHPVVIVVEIVGHVTGDGVNCWWSSADWAQRMGVGSAFLTANIAEYGPSSPYASTTCNAIAQMAGFANGTPDGDNWPYRFCKRFFNCSYKNRLHGPSAGNGFGEAAAGAWQTLTDQYSGINGCTIVAIGGDMSDISGSYTWHINASRLPANEQGYCEDNVAEADGDKVIGVGAVNIKQSNVGQWREWIMEHNTGSFTIDIEKYWVVGGNFSVDYADIINQRISSSTNTLASGATDKQYTVDAATLMGYIENGSADELDINGMLSSAQDVLGGAPLGEQYRVAYATTCKIVAPNGDEVQLANSQTHFAIYGNDNDRTYKFDQVLRNGKSQVKQGATGLDSEKYEAMSGTPTTEDMFISQGGEQWLVKLQYRYVDETYVRKYILRSGDGKPTYHNFMYYKTSGKTSGSGSGTLDGGTHDEQWHSHDSCSTALTASDKDGQSQSVCADALSEFQKAVASFINSIDNNWQEETNYDKDHYDTLYPQKDAGDLVKKCIDDINALDSADADRNTGVMFKRTVDLANANDLDSNKSAPVQVTFKFWQTTSDVHTHSSGDKVRTHAAGCVGGTTCSCDTESYHTLYANKFTSTWNYSIDIDYGDWSQNEKTLKFEDVLKQQYEHTRYLDLVECNVWRLEEGKQKGLQPILAEPTEEILVAVCEKMGYCYYDSTQTNAREWVASRKQWENEEATDLNRTGRLLNSYNKKTVTITLPDGSPVKITDDKDEFVVEYSMENGGRSHHSYEAYYARVAGNMFYDDSGKPYTNFIFCTSDVFDINTGNAGSNGHETFCFYQFNTEDVKGVTGLEQYIMKNANTIYSQYRNLRFHKDDNSGDTPKAVGKVNGKFQENAHLKGIVDLNKMDSDGPYAATYNKAYIAENNPYTFYNSIPNIGGITWVGYRGDYQTTSASHVPELKCISGWTPDMSSAIMKDVWYGYTWIIDEDKNKNTLDSDMAPVGSEFPHKEGLNVNRTQENNIYKTGYAALHYGKAVSIDHTQLSGTLPLGIMYVGANVGVQDTALNNTAPGCAIRATYDDSWETPNDVVVFNPSTAEDATIPRLTDNMPDLAGVWDKDNTLYPDRDQRVNGYYVGTSFNSPIFTESDDIATDTTPLPVSKYKELKAKSDMRTSYLDIDKDYNYIENSKTQYATIGASSTWTVKDTADYTLQVYDGQGMCTAVKVRLNAGDKIKNVGGTIYKVAPSAVVTWDDYITGYNTSYEVDNPYEITDTRIDSYFLKELSTVHAGDVLHLRYKFEDEYEQSTKPFDVNLVVSDSTAIDSKYVNTPNGHTWDYYVEFKKDCVIERINVEFNINTKLEKLGNNEYMFEFVNTFVMSTGSAYSNPATSSSTIDFVYLNNRPCAYNENIASYTYSTYTPMSLESYKCYITYTTSNNQYVIKGSSASNPHIVYNRNWKYYVMGWKTANGVTIESPKDPLLDIDDTVLRWNDKGEAITVGELKNTACLVKYNGSLYLTTKEAGMQHKILQANLVVSSYDMFTFASTGENLSREQVGESSAVTYPIASGQTGQNLFKQHYYEFFFELSRGSGADGYLYDVQYADNLAYKFSKDDTGSPLDSSIAYTQNWEYDWKEVEKQLNSNEIGYTRVNKDIDGIYLSLDDEFKVHYSNIGNYYETDHHNAGSTNVDLGYGWVDGLDTITWIKEKYVKFPFDVYTFGLSSYNTVDPSVTYQEFLNNSLDSSKHRSGTTVGLTFHPAGTEITLGYYEGDSGEADNEGHFIDFGEFTDYDYTFWVCLSSNEGKDFDCTLNSVNINNKLDKEMNKENNNKDTPSGSYWRYANAMRVHRESIVGRIGNLTMLDTGDYRFSDTFKTVESNADWLVYGLIQKLSPYSNQKGVPSTQANLLLDPWDVRGRIGIDSLAPTDYTVYPNTNLDDNTGGYSTYRTQWHKTGSDTGISPLPLTGEFNKHQALKLTQQKIGYANLLTLDSIGNYSGSNGQFVPDRSVQDHDSGTVNSNGDWGDNKIQIRPYYIAIDLTDPNNPVTYPVDVYMHTPNGYEIINSGNTSAKHSLNTLLNNCFNYYLESNTEDEDESNSTYRLDQNMLRRMVTDDESRITYNVVKTYDNPEGTRVVSMLTNPKTLKGNDWDIAANYCYGNGQYLFLRARNRTYVGAGSEALKYEVDQSIVRNPRYQSHAQMWYFDLGLPTSAVFIKSGEPFDLDKIVKKDTIYILSCVDVYALGEVWDLHYKSPVSLSEIEIANTRITADTWNPVQDELKWLIPVTFYNSGDTTAKDDLTTEGTH